MISVIIPTFNRCEMLDEAIQSVLKQDYNDLEIIVIDDNSSDDTFEVIKEYKKRYPCIQYYKNETNMGPGYSRNLGYKHSSGQYIIFMDDDDYYTDYSFFSKAADIFKEDPLLACVSANAYILKVSDGSIKNTDIGIEGKISGRMFIEGLNWKYSKPQSTFTSVFNRVALQQGDIFNMKMVNDAAIYMRALLYGDLFVLKESIGNYRVHGSNISNDLSGQFIIQNLEERLYVAERLINNNNERQEWMRRQCILVYSYYIGRSRPSMKDRCDVLFWILKHNKPSFRFILKLLLTI